MRTRSGAAATASTPRCTSSRAASRCRSRAAACCTTCSRELGVRDRCDFVRVDPCYRVEWPGTHARRAVRARPLRRGARGALPARGEGDPRLPRGLPHDPRRGEPRRGAGGRGPLARPERYPAAAALPPRHARAGARGARRRSAPRARRSPRSGPTSGCRRRACRSCTSRRCSRATSPTAPTTAAARSRRSPMRSWRPRSARAASCSLRAPVRRILVEQGRAVGVLLENGQHVRAPVVISNADARQTIEELCGAEHFPARYVARLHAAPRSISAFVVYAATSLDLAARRPRARDVPVPGPRPRGRARERRRRRAQLVLDHRADARRSLARAAGPAPARAHDARRRAAERARGATSRRRARRRCSRRAERRLPGLRASLRLAEAATPRTMERYTRNSGGAIYGFDVTPAQVGPGRLDNRTPLAGLYLAGHWTRPGGGVAGVVRSGLRTAGLVLGARTERSRPTCVGDGSDARRLSREFLRGRLHADRRCSLVALGPRSSRDP